VRSVAYNPNGTIIASSSDDQTIRLWNALTGECVAVLQGHTGRVRSVAFDSDGEFLVSCGDDGTIKLWQVQTASCTKTLLNERPYERMNITGVTGLSETQKETLRLLGAVEDG
jgi:WD40 repeat protein